MPPRCRSVFQSVITLPALLLSSSLLISGCDGDDDSPGSQVGSSSSQTVVECLTPGAPACWSLTPKTCAPGDPCEPSYQVGDSCAVQRWETTYDVSFIKPGFQDCGPAPSDNSSSSSTASSEAGFTNACSKAAGQRYQSTTLQEVDRGSLGYWQLTFDNQGRFYSLQSDFGLTGHYRCDNNTAILTFDANTSFPATEVTFLDARASRLRFHPFADEELITYTVTGLGEIPACADTNNSVCAVVNTGIVCVTSPCPSQVFKTFGNRCLAEKAKALVAFEGHCSNYEGQPTEGGTPEICTTLYDPVCAKKDQRALVHCAAGGDCNAYQYKSYSNACMARAEKAQFAFAGECRDYDLEEVFSNAYPPALLVDVLPRGYKVSKASIEGDVLTFTAGYSSCSQRHLNLYVAQDSFKLTDSVPKPIIPQWSVSDGMAEQVTCAAAFSTVHNVDLTPLKAAFRKALPTAEGVINLGELGEYRF